jgi:hypothetical protein
MYSVIPSAFLRLFLFRQAVVKLGQLFFHLGDHLLSFLCFWRAVSRRLLSSPAAA